MVARAINRRPSESELAQVLCALGDPVRLDIVRKLAQQGEIPCGGFCVNMPKSSLSHHFRVLREAGIIGSRPEGTSTLNYLETKQMEKRFPGLLASVLGNL